MIQGEMRPVCMMWWTSRNSEVCFTLCIHWAVVLENIIVYCSASYPDQNSDPQWQLSRPTLRHAGSQGVQAALGYLLPALTIPKGKLSVKYVFGSRERYVNHRPSSAVG